MKKDKEFFDNSAKDIWDADPMLRELKEKREDALNIAVVVLSVMIGLGYLYLAYSYGGVYGV